MRLVLLLSTKYKEWNDKRNDGTTGMNGAVTGEIWNVMECFCCGLLDWSYGMEWEARALPWGRTGGDVKACPKLVTLIY